MDIEPLIPPRWARGGHAQTLLGHLWQSPKPITPGQRREIPLPDGDRLVAYIQPGPSARVVYLFHGLGGSTESGYMHRTAHVAHALGHTTIRVNHRGCGAGAGLARQIYHSGSGPDLGQAIAYGRALFPRKDHVAIGFSLSANALLVLLANEELQSHWPNSALAFNAPIDLGRAATKLTEGFNRVYDFRFYRDAIKHVEFGLNGDPREYGLKFLGTLKNFDALYTAPRGGFRDRDDYYARASGARGLERVSVPLTLFTSADDPFVDVQSYRLARLGRQTRLHIEPFGGHLGYVAKSPTPYGTRRWLDYAIDRLLRSI